MAIPHSSMNSDNPFESNAFNQNPFNQPDYSQYFGTRQNPVDHNENMQAQAPQPVNNDPYANVSATEERDNDGDTYRRKHTSYIKNIIWKPRPERHVYRLCATPAYNSNCSSVIGNVTSILTSNSNYIPVLLETEQSKARLLIPDNPADNTIGSNNPIKIGGIDVTNVINMGMNAMTTIGQDSNVRYGGDGEAFLSDSFGDMDGNGVEDNKE